MRTSTAKTVLFLPLGNVLGHVTRSAALAEAFCRSGHTVYMAMTCKYAFLQKLLHPAITVVPRMELPDSFIDRFGYIHHYEEGVTYDRKNIEKAEERCGVYRKSMITRIHSMVQEDCALIDRLHPDCIVTDYRVTAGFLAFKYPERVFQISHVLGYPSYHARVTRKLPPPFDTERVVIPGIPEIEMWRRRKDAVGGRHLFCGPFRWEGWSRLPAAAVPPTDLFLFFGSTGGEKNSIPRLLERIPESYSVSCISSIRKNRDSGSRIHVYAKGTLEQFLRCSRVLLCHGGHGTVMESVYHEVPVMIFPKNIEQLEIGRRVEKMNLGILVKKPLETLSRRELDTMIKRVYDSAAIRRNLKKYSALLRAHGNGAELAMHRILGTL